MDSFDLGLTDSDEEFSDSDYTLLRCNASAKKEVIEWTIKIRYPCTILDRGSESFRIAACSKTMFSFFAEAITNNVWHVRIWRKSDTGFGEDVKQIIARISVLNIPSRQSIPTQSILRYANSTAKFNIGSILGDTLRIRVIFATGEDVEEPLLGNKDIVRELVENLETLLDTGTGSDFKIIIGEDVFPVHREVLAGRSTFFATMFQHDTLESKECQMNIKDISSRTMLHLLRFLYSGEIYRMDAEELIPLYIAADRYNASILKDACSRYLCDQLTNKVVLEVFTLANSYNDSLLKQAAFGLILHNAQELMKSDEWLEFAKHHPDIADSLSKRFV